MILQPPPKAKGGKMMSLINWRLKVTLNDGRQLVGQMLAFDKHMNLVLAECEEFRRVRSKKKSEETGERPEQEIKRSLGLVILRGEMVVSLSVEGPPPVVDEDKKNAVSKSNDVPSVRAPFYAVHAYGRHAACAWKSYNISTIASSCFFGHITLRASTH